MQWLSALDFERTQAETYAQRVEGTSDWILHHPRFRSWLIGRLLSPVLWCHGLAGTGKTIGTSIVVNYLRRAASGPRSAVAFIYCNEDAQPEQTALALLSSLCAQLAAQSATQLPPLQLKLYQQMVALDADRRLDIDNIMLIAMALCDGAFDRCLRVRRRARRGGAGGRAGHPPPEAAVDVGPRRADLHHESDSWRFA